MNLDQLENLLTMNWTTGARIPTGRGAFLFSISSRERLNSIQPLTCFSRVPFLNTKRPVSETELPPSSRVDVCNEYTFTVTVSRVFKDWCLRTLRQLQIYLFALRRVRFGNEYFWNRTKPFWWGSFGRTWQHIWFRQNFTSLKAADLIPDEVTEFLQLTKSF